MRKNVYVKEDKITHTRLYELFYLQLKVYSGKLVV